MKIVLNKSYGGFCLPTEFKALYNINSYEEECTVERTDERLIEFLADKDSYRTMWGKLKVVEIPDTCTDWELNDYDGFESITYVLGGKIFHA